MMRIMVAAYPNFRPQNMQETLGIWETLLEGFSDAQGAAALKAYIASDTKGFAPAIGQIIGLMTTDPDEMTELEAWGLVNKAIQNGNYGADAEFAKLPDTIKRAVGSPGQLREWAQMDISEVQTVAQSNFMRSFRAAVEADRKYRAAPDESKYLFQATREYPALEASPDDRPTEDGIPMPEELKAKLKAIYRKE